MAVVFPWKLGVEMLEVPVKQYKDYPTSRKGAQARRLTDWLIEQELDGLKLAGFIQTDTQSIAAGLGLALLEELPETHAARHYKTWRLFFGGNHIDLAQAVALEYYNFSVCLGLLRAGLRVKPESRNLFVALDQFPGARRELATPGAPVAASDGSKFLDFVRRRSATGIGIQTENASIGLLTNLGTLDWWKPRTETRWRRGKTHPHFALPDWLAAAALAHAHPVEFAASTCFETHEHGSDAVRGLTELYEAFKRYDLWSATGVMPHIRPAERLWAVPSEARDFVLQRAERRHR